MLRLRSRYWILGGIVLFLAILDQWTKGLILRNFRPGESIAIISGYFNLTYVRNTGAAFGILATAEPALRLPLFILVPLGAVALIGWILRKVPENEIRMPLALSLVAGGAVGNLIDRLLYGYVVDFLDFHWNYETHFPAFNVADSAITVGVFLMMLDVLIREEA